MKTEKPMVKIDVLLKVENGSSIEVGRINLNPNVIGAVSYNMFDENDSEKIGFAKIAEVSVEYGNKYYMYQVTIYEEHDQKLEYYMGRIPMLYNKDGYLASVVMESEKIEASSDKLAFQLFAYKASEKF